LATLLLQKRLADTNLFCGFLFEILYVANKQQLFSPGVVVAKAASTL
jgi:hypothetical protein